jgi:hypothetical protein
LTALEPGVLGEHPQGLALTLVVPKLGSIARTFRAGSTVQAVSGERRSVHLIEIILRR